MILNQFLEGLRVGVFVRLTSHVTRLMKHVLMYVESVEDSAKNGFKDLLFLAERESCFIFDGNYFKEIDITTMGTTLVLTLANVFLLYFEGHLLLNSQPDFYSHYNQWCVDYVV